jgi:hypothetical protein
MDVMGCFAYHRETFLHHIDAERWHTNKVVTKKRCQHPIKDVDDASRQSEADSCFRGDQYEKNVYSRLEQRLSLSRS